VRKGPGGGEVRRERERERERENESRKRTKVSQLSTALTKNHQQKENAGRRLTWNESLLRITRYSATGDKRDSQQRHEHHPHDHWRRKLSSRDNVGATFTRRRSLLRCARDKLSRRRVQRGPAGEARTERAIGRASEGREGEGERWRRVWSWLLSLTDCAAAIWRAGSGFHWFYTARRHESASSDFSPAEEEEEEEVGVRPARSLGDAGGPRVILGMAALELGPGSPAAPLSSPDSPASRSQLEEDGDRLDWACDRQVRRILRPPQMILLRRGLITGFIGASADEPIAF
jgi:hypothetical protein